MAAEARICTTGGKAAADNFSAIVDVVGLHELQSCVWRNGSVQIDDRAVDPNDRAAGAIAGEGLPNDLTTGVNRIRSTNSIILKSSKIDDLSPLPESRMEGLAAVSNRPADCLPRIIKPNCLCEDPSRPVQCLQVR